MNIPQIASEMHKGKMGQATKKAMEILLTLGEIYGAKSLIPITSVQIAGVSYDNLGEAGLEYLSSMANNNGKTRVLSTLNPAGMDRENWRDLGIPEDFVINQNRVLESFSKMGVITTCSCTPYFFGNLPHFNEHIAWSESSAVCYANSVIGARTNREGGPSALASALTGFTPAYGLHLTENRIPTIHVEVNTELSENHEFGALGKAIGEKIEADVNGRIPYITGIKIASVENLKSFCASIATFGGVALFHIQNLTPEASNYDIPLRKITIENNDIQNAISSISNANPAEIDFVSLGCPHLSIKEIARIAQLVEGKQVTKEFWITTARPTKQISDNIGYTKIIEASGAKFAADTCCVVAPIKQRFKAMATDSAKACYYAYAKNKFHTMLKPFDEVVLEALK